MPLPSSPAINSSVWQRVNELNEAHCKVSSTSALAATLQDPTLSKARAALADQVVKALAQRPLEDHLVGMAYAVNGAMRNVRVFANHELYTQFIGHLSQTAAFDALSDPGTKKNEEQLERQDVAEISDQELVVGFVTHIRDHADERTVETAGHTQTTYLRARRGYGAVASWIADAEEHREVPFTATYVARPSETPPAPRSACML